MAVLQRQSPFRMTLFKTFDPVSGYATEGVPVTAVNNAVTYSVPWLNYLGRGKFGFQLRWTGTVKGVWSIQFSDKDQPDQSSDADWTTDTTMAPVNPAGAPGSYGDNGEALHRWYRFKLVQDGAAPGAGTLTGDVTYDRN